MALITCPECGARVSDAATSCPKCGCPLTKTKVCFACKANIAENASVCPNCGHPQNLVRVRVVDDEKTRKCLAEDDNNFKWQIYTLTGSNKIILAEGRGFGTLEFAVDTPVKACFRYFYGPITQLKPTGACSCLIQPGASYKIYCTKSGIFANTSFIFEEDT